MGANQQQYKIGDVVNGYRWSGVAWEPVMPTMVQGTATPIKRPWYRRWWAVTALIVVALAAVGLIFGDDADVTGAGDDQEAPAAVSSDEVTPGDSADEDTGGEISGATAPTAQSVARAVSVGAGVGYLCEPVPAPGFECQSVLDDGLATVWIMGDDTGVTSVYGAVPIPDEVLQAIGEEVGADPQDIYSTEFGLYWPMS